jgi:hypothetical protein
MEPLGDDFWHQEELQADWLARRLYLGMEILTPFWPIDALPLAWPSFSLL